MTVYSTTTTGVGGVDSITSYSSTSSDWRRRQQLNKEAMLTGDVTDITGGGEGGGGGGVRKKRDQAMLFHDLSNPLDICHMNRGLMKQNPSGGSGYSELGPCSCEPIPVVGLGGCGTSPFCSMSAACTCTLYQSAGGAQNCCSNTGGPHGFMHDHHHVGGSVRTSGDLDRT